MRPIALQVAYNGAAFCGSQRQTNGRSVQGEIEGALEKLLGVPHTISLAGRTDAGVHATGQVALFRLENPNLSVERVPLALNTKLDSNVRILKSWEVADDFHPRFSAKSRTYIYRIELATVSNPLLRTVATLVKEQLNLALMHEAAARFLGRHDFAAWQSAGSPTTTTVREIKRLEFRQTWAFGSQILEIEICADAFLYQMVRNIVGALLQIGRGKLTTNELPALFEGKDRTKCPPPALPQGLCLVNVEY